MQVILIFHIPADPGQARVLVTLTNDIKAGSPQSSLCPNSALDFLSSSVCTGPQCSNCKLFVVVKTQALYVDPEGVGTFSGKNEIQAVCWLGRTSLSRGPATLHNPVPPSHSPFSFNSPFIKSTNKPINHSLFLPFLRLANFLFHWSGSWVLLLKVFQASGLQVPPQLCDGNSQDCSLQTISLCYGSA